MAAKSARKSVPGSDKQAMPKAKPAGKLDPEERIEISVLLRPRADTRGAMEARNFTSPELASRQYASREALAAERGAAPDDIAKVEAFAQDHHLTVVEESIPRRTVKLSGTIADLEAAFRPNLKQWKVGSRTFRGRTGPISVPADLANIVVAVLGFDNRPAVRPHLLYRDGPPPSLNGHAGAANKGAGKSAGKASKSKSSKKSAKAQAAGAANGGGRVVRPRNAPDGSFKPTEVAKLYNFPAGLNGSGQCIAIIELNDTDSRNRVTGTGFSASDLKAYFQAIGVPLPSVTAVGVDGGANKPGPDANADGEVMLDIEVAGAVAPGANIAVYFAPNTDQGFVDALTTAVHDSVRKPSVVSISWGAQEEAWTQQALNAFDQALQDAAAMGVTVCCAAGDDGSSDIREANQRDGQPHVDFPAANPFSLACGGTKLLGSGTQITSEVVWNEGDSGTGGGVSNAFARPAYQAHSSVPKSPKGKRGRGVPDIAGDADPETGYQVRLVGGQNAVIGGTSAVAPLWAGLVALLNQKLTGVGKPPIGFCNPFLYNSLSHSAAALHDITHGNNDIEGLGKYKARKGWDPCTGLGTPDGEKLLAALTA
jgi:kumamolisin